MSHVASIKTFGPAKKLEWLRTTAHLLQQTGSISRIAQKRLEVLEPVKAELPSLPDLLADLGLYADYHKEGTELESVVAGIDLMPENSNARKVTINAVFNEIGKTMPAKYMQLVSSERLLVDRFLTHDFAQLTQKPLDKDASEAVNAFLTYNHSTTLANFKGAAATLGQHIKSAGMYVAKGHGNSNPPAIA